jgi:hypothetical protein
MPLCDRDQTECGSQEIVGQKNAASDGSNRLLRRRDCSRSQTPEGNPKDRLLALGVVRKVLTIL